MSRPYSMQVFQDWFTQQWVIIRGKKIDPGKFSWLLGPFRDQLTIGESNDELRAVQTLTLYNFRVLNLNYEIKKRNKINEVSSNKR